MKQPRPQRREFVGQAGSIAGLMATRPLLMAQNRHDADLIVWDSTPGGITTAIAAARSGLSVKIVTEDRHLGGMQTSGLGNTNAGQRATVGGLAREFHERIHAHYVKRYGPDAEQVRASSGGFHFEPHAAEEVYKNWLSEAGVECLTEEVVESVQKAGPEIISVRTNRGRMLRASIFADASYEGDLFKLAGCSYSLGRESSQQYGEPLAGVRFPPEAEGRADAKIQAYDYRLCLSDAADNRVPFERPRTYQRTHYAYQEALLKLKPPTRLHEAIPLNMMPNRKTDSRTAEWPGASWNYPEADRAERRRIEERHRDYSAGYLWFLLHEDVLPAPLREELSKWGLAKDEFADNGNWPYHLYVREGRRLVGDFVMTQGDVTERRFQPDAVALGNFYLDVHAVEIIATQHAIVAEGWLGNPRVKPYEIPYRALLPKRAEATNLLAPVSLSASHIAFSTIRMEPVWMMLGHAAGVAAAISLKDGVALHNVPVKKLKDRLLDQGQILDAKEFNEFWPPRRGLISGPSDTRSSQSSARP